jgi:hypothetical protein
MDLSGKFPGPSEMGGTPLSEFDAQALAREWLAHAGVATAFDPLVEHDDHVLPGLFQAGDTASRTLRLHYAEYENDALFGISGLYPEHVLIGAIWLGAVALGAWRVFGG